LIYYGDELTLQNSFIDGSRMGRSFPSPRTGGRIFWDDSLWTCRMEWVIAESLVCKAGGYAVLRLLGLCPKPHTRREAGVAASCNPFSRLFGCWASRGRVLGSAAALPAGRTNPL